MPSRSHTLSPSGVRRIRKRLGLTQAGFADLLYVHSNTVAKWERGELGMKPTTARLIQLVTAAEKPKPKRG